MKEKESVQERLVRLKKDKAAAADKTELVSQLHHESAGETDFSKMAAELEKRKAKEARGENEGYVKLTMYIEKDVAAAFNALITKRGQQKEFCNQALKEFVQKKVRELGL